MTLLFGGLPIVEPIPIEDKLCTALVCIEDVGFGARFVLAHRQTIYEAGTICMVVKEKIILPNEWIPPGIAMASNFMARKCVRVAGSHLLRLVPAIHPDIPTG